MFLSGGKNYTTTPDLVIVNPDTGLEDTTGSIEATINGSAIALVLQLLCHQEV